MKSTILTKLIFFDTALASVEKTTVWWPAAVTAVSSVQGTGWAGLASSHILDWQGVTQWIVQ